MKDFDDFFEEFFDFEAAENNERHYLIVVIYDIMDNKRRTKLSKLLKGYGRRVQRSSFECQLTRKQYDKMINEIGKFRHPTDLIRIYRIAGKTDVQIWGDVALTEYDDFIIL